MTEKQQLDAELTEILKHLPGWQLDPDYAAHTWCAVLRDGTGGDSRQRHASQGPPLSQRHVAVATATASIPPDKHLHITVARNRPPENCRRNRAPFLPWYLAAYAEKRSGSRDNEARNRQQELTRRPGRILGPDITPRMQGNPTRIYAKGLTVEVHGNAT